MNLNYRLRSLERAVRPAAPAACTDCGGGGGGGPTTYRLLPITLEGGEWVRPDPGPERCPRCGRRLVVRLRPILLDEKW